MSYKNKQIKKILNLLLKIGISGGSLFYIFYLLGYEKSDMVENVRVYFAAHEFSLSLLVFVVLLMGVNWGAEIFKWRILANYIMPTNYWLATKSTLAGVAASVFTPFRVGSYFGKVALFPYRYRAKGLVLQLYNAMAMFVVNFFFGLLFLGILGLNGSEDIIGISPNLFAFLGFLGAGIVLVFWVLFVYVKHLIALFDKIPFTRKWSKFFKLVNDGAYKSIAVQLLAVSILRYLAITLQYVLTYKVFGIEINSWQIFIASGALFFIFQFLPVFNAVELGVTRTALLSIILTTFGLVTELTPQMTLGVTSASFVIWLINLAVPSIVGSLFLSQVKVLKES